MDDTLEKTTENELIKDEKEEELEYDGEGVGEEEVEYDGEGVGEDEEETDVESLVDDYEGEKKKNNETISELKKIIRTKLAQKSQYNNDLAKEMVKLLEKMNFIKNIPRSAKSIFVYKEEKSESAEVEREKNIEQTKLESDFKKPKVTITEISDEIKDRSGDSDEEKSMKKKQTIKEDDKHLKKEILEGEESSDDDSPYDFVSDETEDLFDLGKISHYSEITWIAKKIPFGKESKVADFYKKFIEKKEKDKGIPTHSTVRDEKYYLLEDDDEEDDNPVKQFLQTLKIDKYYLDQMKNIWMSTSFTNMTNLEIELINKLDKKAKKEESAEANLKIEGSSNSSVEEIIPPMKISGRLSVNSDLDESSMKWLYPLILLT